MKRLIAVLLAVILSLIAAVGVSANDQITLDDWGWYMSRNYESYITLENLTDGWIIGRFMIPWFTATLDANYTYTYTTTVQIRYSGSDRFIIDHNYLQTVYYNDGEVKSAGTTLKTYKTGLVTIELVSTDGNTVTYRIKYIFNLTKDNQQSGQYTHYLMIFNSGIDGVRCTIGNEILTCTYDPGGNYYDKLYANYLNQIVNAGSGYPLPDEAASTLGNSLNSLDSAEASLSSKADELRTAGSATMASAVAAAKDLPNKIGASTTFLATTFTSFWEAIPEEVTAVLIVCAAIIFAGWLIGRIQ